jgi:hypothetical protein
MKRSVGQVNNVKNKENKSKKHKRILEISNDEKLFTIYNINFFKNDLYTCFYKLNEKIMDFEIMEIKKFIKSNEVFICTMEQSNKIKLNQQIKTKFFNYKLILIPFITNAHYYLYVVYNFLDEKNGFITKVDSIENKSNQNEIRLILNYLNDQKKIDTSVQSKINLSVKKFKSTKQSNGIDCGIFVLINLKRIAMQYNHKKLKIAHKISRGKKRAIVNKKRIEIYSKLTDFIKLKTGNESNFKKETKLENEKIGKIKFIELNDLRKVLLSIPPPPPDFLVNGLRTNIYIQTRIEDLNKIQIKIMKNIDLLIDNSRQLGVQEKSLVNNLIEMTKIPPPPLPLICKPTNYAKKLIRNVKNIGIGSGNSTNITKKRLAKQSVFNQLMEMKVNFIDYAGVDLDLFDKIYETLAADLNSHKIDFYKNSSTTRSNPRRKCLENKDRLLLYLMVMKQNLSMSGIKLLFKVSPSFISKEVRFINSLILTNLKKQIDFTPGYFDNPHPITGCNGSVDGSVISTTKYHPLQKSFYGNKGHGINSQLIVDRSGEICDFGCGFFGKTNDKYMFHLLDSNRVYQGKLFADDGYIDKNNNKLVTSKDVDNELKSTIKFERCIVENVFGFIKSFKILSATFRYKIELLPSIATAIVLITNMKLKKNPIRDWDSIHDRDNNNK